jgi:hypothetical protein
VVCQIVRVEHLPHGTLVDIVTLEPCRRGTDRLPAGTPLALGFGSEPSEDTRSSLETVMTLWDTTGALLDLHVEEMPLGLRYHFSCGDRFLTLLVEDRPAA